jgi:hypothetical protein
LICTFGDDDPTITSDLTPPPSMTPVIVTDIEVEPAVEKMATRLAVSMFEVLSVVTGVGAVLTLPKPAELRATSNLGMV